jgi:DNA-binding transcriptional LysR family regulator
MELRHFRYFIAVAEEQNITRAAARLRVSQPPLSRQIRDLESEIGAALFERTRRAVRLTPAGWALLDQAYAVLRQADQAVSAARAATGGGKRELRVGYAPGPTQEFLRELLRRLQAVSPPVRLRLLDLSTGEMMDGLRAGDLDAALAVKPRPAMLHGLHFEKLREDPLVVVVAPDHPLAKRRVVRLREFVREPFVTFSRKDYPEHYEGMREMLGGGTVKLKIAEETDSGMTLFAAIEAGRGVSILSSSLVGTIGTRLRMIPLRPAPPPNVIGFAYVANVRDPLLARLLAAGRDLTRHTGIAPAAVRSGQSSKWA